MFERIKRWWINVGLSCTVKSRIKKLDRILWHVNDIVQYPSVQKLCPEAVERANYLFSCGQIYTPVISEKKEVRLESLNLDSAYRTILPESDLEHIFIFPLFLDDAHLGPIMKYYTENVELAAYAQSINTIVLNLDHYETDRFAATCLLHEIGHVQVAKKEGRVFIEASRGPESVERMEEELQMWLFDCRLAQIIGGQEYCAQMERTMAQIAHIRACGMNYQSSVGDGWPLDSCYGKAPNQKAIDHRDFVWWAYSELMAAERYLNKENAHNHQLQLMKHIHKECFEKQKNDLIRLKQRIAQ